MKTFKKVKAYIYGKGIVETDITFGERIENIGGDAFGEITELPSDALVLPGFIDEHVHGGGGADAMDGTVQALDTISRALAEEGTTAFLATTMTQSESNILRAMEAVKAFRETENAGARMIGVHLEGPFISTKYKGAHPEQYIVPPSVELFKKYNAASGDLIKIVTIAPEVTGAQALIRYLAKVGVVASIGHTAATYEDVVQAVECGATSVTHTFNAQSPLNHRAIGVVGGALMTERLYCELICDLLHVCAPAVKLLEKNKPNDKLVLITDSMRNKGCADGESELGGQKVIVKNGEARLSDGTLAGSVLRMNKAVANLTKAAGVSIEHAVDCATINPARNLGIDGEVGSIAPSKRADFAVVDKNFDVIMTVVGGKTVYAR